MSPRRRAKDRELRARSELQLAEQVRNVVLDRFVARAESCRLGVAGGLRTGPSLACLELQAGVIEVFYRYRVHPAQARAFEHAYGPTGPWARLFARHPGFRRTRLFRHRKDPSLYITIDVWASKEAYDEFRAQNVDDYNRLDAELAMLKLEEHLLGYYDGPDEYREPLDALA